MIPGLQHIQHYTKKPFGGGFSYIEMLKTLDESTKKVMKSCPKDGGNYKKH